MNDLFLHYMITTLIVLIILYVCVFLIQREKSRSEDKISAINQILEEQTFPALESAGRAVQSSQDLLLSLQNAMGDKRNEA